MDLGPTVEISRRAGLPLIEDCAQAFLGPGESGYSGALASMFSFGPIKTSTALGGALTHVRASKLLEKMRALHAARPRQTQRCFAGRVARFLALSSIRGPSMFGFVQSTCAVLGIDFEARLEAAVRGFPGGPQAMLAGIRRQPSAPLLSLLARRLDSFDAANLALRVANGERLRAVAGRHLPGHRQPIRTHWLVPFLARAPCEMIGALRAHGFDAAQGTTSLAVIGGAGSSWLSQLVYLPAYPEVSAPDFERLVAIAARFSQGEIPSGLAATVGPSRSFRAQSAKDRGADRAYIRCPGVRRILTQHYRPESDGDGISC